ncbi:hypothetical protein E2C01_102792 [Portunus trituberculatus]|uniref:Uncharacterized protein n=1 Tax=Portunus trituberculatus TaxID=210409 RepID=A0A5B7KJ70_PORTR|nr:hypothetical protein [Portunus trituberculatus]
MNTRMSRIATNEPKYRIDSDILGATFHFPKASSGKLVPVYRPTLRTMDS